MNVAVPYNDLFVRMPLGCDMSKLLSFVKRMGGMVVSIPTVEYTEPEQAEPSVDDIFGVWSDADYPDADAMCKFLKSSRSAASLRKAKLDVAWEE